MGDRFKVVRWPIGTWGAITACCMALACGGRKGSAGGPDAAMDASSDQSDGSGPEAVMVSDAAPHADAGAPGGDAATGSGGATADGPAGGTGGRGQGGAPGGASGAAGAGGRGASGGAMGAIGGSAPAGLVVPLFAAARVVGPRGPNAVPLPDAVDVDGDGWLDLSIRLGDTIGVAINDHKGGYREVVETLFSRSLASVAFGDLNGDGRSDVIVATAPMNPYVAEGQSDGSFTMHKELVLGGPNVLSRLVAAGDLNGDHLADVVVADSIPAGAVGRSAALYVLLNEGQGTLGAPKMFVLSGTQTSLPLSVTVRDLDGDGMGEVLIAGNGDTMVVPNLGGGTLGSHRTYPISHPVALADVNGDGRLDLMGHGSVGFYVFLGTASDFTETAPVQICRWGGGLAVADLTGDGRPDIACNDRANVRVYSNLGNLLFGDPVDLAGLGNVTAIADWDHDGDPDLIADGGTVVFFNEAGSFPKLSVGNARPQARTVAVGDLDGDGVMDIVTADTGGTRVHLGRADGTFGSVSPLTALAATNQPALGDLDGDGRLDLVVSYTEPAGRIGIARNDGTGRFGEPTFFGTGPYPASAEVADVNADGKRDIVVRVAGGVSVLLNDGQGRFPSHVDYQLGDRRGMVTGDLNGDGAPDIVAVGPDGVSVLRNQRDGTFSPEAAFQPGGLSVALVDLNGDERPEIALGGLGGLVVHRNNGDGTFGGLAAVVGRQPDQRDDPVGSVGVSVGDLNRDGRADLVTFHGAGTSAAVRTYFSDGTGTLWRGDVYALAPSPADVAFGDLNSDGRPDMVLPRR